MHDTLSGGNLIEERILGSKEPIEGNTCYCVRTLKDGLSFVSTHEDFVSREFEVDLEGKKLIEKFKYEGHSNTVRYVNFKKDESRIVTCCED